MCGAYRGGRAGEPGSCLGGGGLGVLNDWCITIKQSLFQEKKIEPAGFEPSLVCFDLVWRENAIRLRRVGN